MTTKFTLVSLDGDSFSVDQTVMDASSFLKGCCDNTEVNEPIEIGCSSICLSTYINLIGHYVGITEEHDPGFESGFFAGFDDAGLVGLVQEMAILDSDFYFEAIADFILRHISEMNWQEMQNYLGFLDDYSADERQAIMTNEVLYLVSVNVGPLIYPLADNIGFEALQSRFQSPLNAVMDVIILRSNPKIKFQLSMINKTIKNKIDKRAIHVAECIFDGSDIIFRLGNDSEYIVESTNEILGSLVNRKIFAEQTVRLIFDSEGEAIPNGCRDSYMRFIDPASSSSTLNVTFMGNKAQMNDFQIQQCQFPSIIYTLSSINMPVIEFYDKLIKNGLTKEIRVNVGNVFEVFDNNLELGVFEELILLKKPGTAKFHQMDIPSGVLQFGDDFKDFLRQSALMNFMECDGLLIADGDLFPVVQNAYDNAMGMFKYQVGEVLALRP